MSGRLVGLGGRLTSGKDVVADHLVAAHGFTKLGMSDPLLAAALAIDPYIPINAKSIRGVDGLWGSIVKFSWLVKKAGYVEAKKNPAVREFLQKLGTDFGREMIGENVWVDIHARNIRSLLEQGHDVTITGLRFPNEIAMIAKLGGLSLWVDRPDNPTPPAAAGHASESGVEEGDFGSTVINDGTLKELRDRTDNIINELENEMATSSTQKVLLDGGSVMDMALEQPSDPKKAIVESFSTGPLVVDRSRIKPLL
jgi:hypothetical protein